MYNKNRGYQTQALRVLTTGSALRTLPAHSAPPVIRHTTFSTLSLRANILNQILRPQEAPGFGEYDGGRARSMQRLPRTLLPPAQPGHRGMPGGCDSHVPGVAASRMPAGSTWPLRARRWASQNHAAAAPYAVPACSAWTPRDARRVRQSCAWLSCVTDACGKHLASESSAVGESEPCSSCPVRCSRLLSLDTGGCGGHVPGVAESRMPAVARGVGCSPAWVTPRSRRPSRGELPAGPLGADAM